MTYAPAKFPLGAERRVLPDKSNPDRWLALFTAKGEVTRNKKTNYARLRFTPRLGTTEYTWPVSDADEYVITGAAVFTRSRGGKRTRMIRIPQPLLIPRHVQPMLHFTLTLNDI